VKPAKTVPLTSRWRVYLRLGRVSNLPTVWTNCLAGIILAGAVPEAATFLLLMASMCLMYVSGMFLNDAFDQDFDKKYRPERPIPAGEITGRNVYRIGFALMAMGLAILAAAGRMETIVWGLTLAALIVYYNYRHKTDPASPLIMAACRVMVYFCAASAAGSTALTLNVIAGAGILMAYMIGLTYVAKQENLSEVKNLWPLVFLAAPFLYATRALPAPAVLIQYVLFLIWVLYALSHLVRQIRKIPVAVVSLIAGISLLDGLLIATVDPAMWSWLGIAGFALTLFFQRYVAGT
jgi:hypothetical protein